MQKVFVIVDTNVVYAKSLTELVGYAARKAIAAPHSHLSVEWCIPTVVFSERVYQMRGVAQGLNKAVTQLEGLFGRSLDLSPDGVSMQVELVARQKAIELGLRLVDLNLDDVDWGEMIKRALERTPPFEPESEKGFRDALVLETTWQLVEREPRASMFVFLTGDGRLQEAASRQFESRNNVLVLGSLEEATAALATLERARLSKSELQHAVSTVEADAGQQVIDMPIEELEWTIRSFNILKRAGINFVGQLLGRSRKEEEIIGRFDDRTLAEVKAQLAGLGLPATPRDP